MTRPANARALALLLALCAAAPAAAQQSFDWHIDDSGSVNAMLELTEFHTDIVNTGPQADTYRITLVADMSTNWTTTMCDTNLCYPPFITQREYTVPPGGSVFVGINITPNVDPGLGVSRVTVESLTAPELSYTADFQVVSEGLDVLVVDAGSEGVDLLGAALDAAGRTHAVWNRASAGKLLASELANFGVVAWAAGPRTAGLDADDRAALADYLTAGGRVLLAGEDLVWAAADAASPAQDPAAAAWYAAYLGAAYVADDAAAAAVAGWPGDAVGDGLAFAITGGDGVGSAAPDLIAAADDGVRAFIYNLGGAAGVRNVAGAGKSLLLPFEFGAVSTAAHRAALLDAALAWFDAQASAAPDTPGRAGLTVAAAPNPFNPRTVLSFAVPGEGRTPVTVTVYDVAGRLVRRLHDGPLPAGPATLTWNGVDDGGRPLPGGLYIARVAAGGDAGRIKLVLAK